MTNQVEKANLFRSLHVPGDPLILCNVWDAVTARIVAGVPGVKAIASASHSVSYAHGVPDGEGLSIDQALEAAREIVGAVELPVTIDFERAYAKDVAHVRANVARLLETGAVGLNIEDSSSSSKMVPVMLAAERVAVTRAAAEDAGIPLVINARVDSLVRGAQWSDMLMRANAYLDSGADSIFVLGLGGEDDVKRAVDEIHGSVAVIASPTSVPLQRLAELGVARVSFGPRILGLTLSHLRGAAAQLTSLGAYPSELAFDY
ncbi:MAG TPA: isocitrate lyase/phosphoenolpyruvate mutase family protein [Galbitalea sp.]|jgi:2-methylisocitrate lyase-like PEP mutase family enzyme|nr:isocitrate lyase/phosphoenolpyruvate mutase family protein [Galbitalea sp.]